MRISDWSSDVCSSDLMDRVPGTRDVSEAANAAEAQRIAEESIEILARIHSLDTAPFVAAGVAQTSSPEETAFAYLAPNIAIFHRIKKIPQPMMEWALRSVSRNVPRDCRSSDANTSE